MQLLHTLCRRIGNFVLLFGAMPDLHYINGPDTLPPPPTPQEEQVRRCKQSFRAVVIDCPRRKNSRRCAVLLRAKGRRGMP